jgi:hypothetical protein
MFKPQRDARRDWPARKQARYFLGDLCFWLEERLLALGSWLNEFDEPTPEEIAISVARGQHLVAGLLKKERLRRDHPCPACGGRGVVELVGEDDVQFQVCSACHDSGIDPAWKGTTP